MIAKSKVYAGKKLPTKKRKTVERKFMRPTTGREWKFDMTDMSEELNTIIQRMYANSKYNEFVGDALIYMNGMYFISERHFRNNLFIAARMRDPQRTVRRHEINESDSVLYLCEDTCDELSAIDIAYTTDRYGDEDIVDAINYIYDIASPKVKQAILKKYYNVKQEKSDITNFYKFKKAKKFAGAVKKYESLIRG